MRGTPQCWVHPCAGYTHLRGTPLCGVHPVRGTPCADTPWGCGSCGYPHAAATPAQNNTIMFTYPGSGTVETSPLRAFLTMVAFSGKDSGDGHAQFTGKESKKFFWWDTRTDKQRRREKRDRKNPLCKVRRCPRFGRRGWYGGFCKQCAAKKENGCTKPVVVQKRCKKDAAKIAGQNKLKIMAETAVAEKKCVEQNKHRRFVFPVRNKQQHAVTDLSNDENKENMQVGEDAWKKGESKPQKDLTQKKGVEKKVKEPKSKAKTLLGNCASLDAMNEGVIEKAEDAGGKRWSKEVVFVPKLPPITQPTMEREKQRGMGCRDVKALRHRMGNYPDSSYVTPLRRPTGGMRTQQGYFDQGGSSTKM